MQLTFIFTLAERQFKIWFVLQSLIPPINALEYMPVLNTTPSCCFFSGKKCGKLKNYNLPLGSLICWSYVMPYLWLALHSLSSGKLQALIFPPQYLIAHLWLFHLILCFVNTFPTLQCNFNSNYIFNVTFNSTYKLQKKMQKNICYLGFIQELTV